MDKITLSGTEGVIDLLNTNESYGDTTAPQKGSVQVRQLTSKRLMVTFAGFMEDTSVMKGIELKINKGGVQTKKVKFTDPTTASWAGDLSFKHDDKVSACVTATNTFDKKTTACSTSITCGIRSHSPHTRRELEA